MAAPCGLNFFPLNVFTEFVNSVTKIFVITLKGLEPATQPSRDQDVTTAPARQMWETISLNWAQFILQWFITFPEFSEFLFHLGKNSQYFLFQHHALQHRFLYCEKPFGFSQIDKICNDANIGITGPYYMKKSSNKMLTPVGIES